MTTRINFVVDEDIPDLLIELAGGERKRGQYLSQLVRSLYAEHQQRECNESQEPPSALSELSGAPASDAAVQRSDLDELYRAVIHLSNRVHDLEATVAELRRQRETTAAKREPTRQLYTGLNLLPISPVGG